MELFSFSEAFHFDGLIAAELCSGVTPPVRMSDSAANLTKGIA